MDKHEGPQLSLCRCGHTGNVADSQHGPRYAPGHGKCLVEGCECRQFTYVSVVVAKPTEDDEQDELRLYEIDEDGCEQTWVVARTAQEALGLVYPPDSPSDATELSIVELGEAKAAQIHLEEDGEKVTLWTYFERAMQEAKRPCVLASTHDGG